jgi:Bacteriophage protein GP30.3
MALYAQSDSFRQALRASGDEILTHYIGRCTSSGTVLTQAEFCDRLMKLRKDGTL